jgi:hypothetical protein
VNSNNDYSCIVWVLAITAAIVVYVWLRNRAYRTQAPARAAAAEAEAQRIASMPVLGVDERKAKVGLHVDASIRQGWRLVGYESDGYGAVLGKVVGGVNGCFLLVLLVLGILPGILYLLIAGKHEERVLLRVDERGNFKYTKLGNFKV